MNIQKLEKEIDQASNRITSRETEIELELKVLRKNIRRFTSLAWICVIAGILIGAYGINYFAFFRDPNEFGLNNLGDFLSGSVSSLWSLAGLFFIYVAFLGQKQQLLTQQLEIMYSQLEVKFTRLELNGQKAEMKEQNSTLKLQKFENTFFQMLNLFNSIVTSLDLRKIGRPSEVISKGRDCFEIFYRRFTNQLITQGIPKNIHRRVSIEETLEAYSVFYKDNKSDMSHYFRTLYHIIKIIDRSDIDSKNHYTSIVRAQLSSYEQVMLFYNCLHENGIEKFKPLVEKYSLLKNIDDSLVLNRHHFEAYEKSAYGL